MNRDVVVVGAGLAGLTCAKRLQAAGLRPIVLEADHRPGGRVGGWRRPDGHMIDRGFQVMFTSYPSAPRALDMAALDMKSYDAGALVRVGTAWQAVADPTRHPTDLVSTLGARLASPFDALIALRLRLESAFGLGVPSARTTAAHLHALGFSRNFLASFLEPFLAGIWLDRSLDVDAKLFYFYWRMLVEGQAAVPAMGMQAIPDQLAAGLTAGSLRLGSRVAAIARDESGRVVGVRLEDGSLLEAGTVVIATPHPEACRLLGETPRLRGKPALTLYFSADKAPTERRLIALSPDPRSPIGVVAVPSNVAPLYAPEGQHQVAVQALPTDHGAPTLDPDEARRILAGWFPEANVPNWRYLESVAVPFGQFDQAPGTQRDAMVREPGLFLAGEATTQSSIEGALSSGLACAEAIVESLSASASR